MRHTLKPAWVAVPGMIEGPDEERPVAPGAYKVPLQKYIQPNGCGGVCSGLDLARRLVTPALMSANGDFHGVMPQPSEVAVTVVAGISLSYAQPNRKQRSRWSQWRRSLHVSLLLSLLRDLPTSRGSLRSRARSHSAEKGGKSGQCVLA